MNYLVPKRKKDFIHQEADSLRQKYGFTKAYVDIIALFDLLKKDGALSYHILEDEAWLAQYSDLEAFSQAHSREIFFPDRLLSLIEDHDITRSRFTLAHELGHVLLHSSDLQGELFDGNLHPLVQSSEWQANYFAGALLAPDRFVELCESLQELIDLCRISWQAARVRFKQTGKPLTPEAEGKDAGSAGMEGKGSAEGEG